MIWQNRIKAWNYYISLQDCLNFILTTTSFVGLSLVSAWQLYRTITTTIFGLAMAAISAKAIKTNYRGLNQKYNQGQKGFAQWLCSLLSPGANLAILNAAFTAGAGGDPYASLLLSTWVTGKNVMDPSTGLATFQFGEGSSIGQHIENLGSFANFVLGFEDLYDENPNNVNGLNQYLTKYFPDLTSDLFLHTLMGGYQGLSVSVLTTDYLETFTYTFMDHFGAGKDDANSWLPALSSMYYLQHNFGTSTQYTAFIWTVSHIDWPSYSANIKMKNIHKYLIVFTLVSISSCLSKTSPSRVYFYFRSGIGFNNYKSYFDHLAITEYENKKLTAMDFFRYAKQYLDTTKAKLPIDLIDFAGQGPGESIPEGSWYTIKDQLKYEIISFGFNSSVQPVRYNKYNLVLVSIFVDGQNHDFTKEEIDSVMESRIPLDNGNN